MSPAWLGGEAFPALLRADATRVAEIRTRAGIVLE